MADPVTEDRFQDYLGLLRRFLKLNRRRQGEIEAELLDHMAERLSDLAERGVAQDEAIAVALEEFGDAAALAAEFTATIRWKRRRQMMRLTYGTLCASLALAFGLAVFWPSGDTNPLGDGTALAQGEDPYQDETLPDDPDAATAEKLANTIVDLDFVETGLIDVMDKLEKDGGVQITLDLGQLDLAGVDSEQPITRKLKGISLETGLWFILRDLALAYAIKGGVVVITTPEGLATIDSDWIVAPTMYAWQQNMAASGPNAITAEKLANYIMPVEFVDDALTDVLQMITAMHDLQVYIERHQIEDAGIDINSPVTLYLKKASVETILWFLLRDLNLTYVLKEGIIVITTPEAAEDMLDTRVYPIGDLMGDDFEEFMDILTSSVAPTTWETAGGPGSISYYRETLIIRQTDAVHRDIMKLLSDLQLATRGRKPSGRFLGGGRAGDKPSGNPFADAPPAPGAGNNPFGDEFAEPRQDDPFGAPREPKPQNPFKEVPKGDDPYKEAPKEKSPANDPFAASEGRFPAMAAS